MEDDKITTREEIVEFLQIRSLEDRLVGNIADAYQTLYDSVRERTLQGYNTHDQQG